MRTNDFVKLNIQFDKDNVLKEIAELPEQAKLITDIDYFRYIKNNTTHNKVNEIYFEKSQYYNVFYIKKINTYTDINKLLIYIDLKLIYG